MQSVSQLMQAKPGLRADPALALAGAPGGFAQAFFDVIAAPEAAAAEETPAVPLDLAEHEDGTTVDPGLVGMIAPLPAAMTGRGSASPHPSTAPIAATLPVVVPPSAAWPDAQQDLSDDLPVGPSPAATAASNSVAVTAVAGPLGADNADLPQLDAAAVPERSGQDQPRSQHALAATSSGRNMPTLTSAPVLPGADSAAPPQATRGGSPPDSQPPDLRLVPPPTGVLRRADNAGAPMAAADPGGPRVAAPASDPAAVADAAVLPWHGPRHPADPPSITGTATVVSPWQGGLQAAWSGLQSAPALPAAEPTGAGPHDVPLVDTAGLTITAEQSAALARRPAEPDHAPLSSAFTVPTARSTGMPTTPTDAPPVGGPRAVLDPQPVLGPPVAALSAPPLDTPALVDPGHPPDTAFGIIGTPVSTLSASTGAGPAMQVPLAQLAAQIVHSLADPTTATTEIALSPDDLGHVRVSIQAHDTDPTRVVVTMTFERPEVMDLFRRHADQLIADMRAAGFSGADLGFAQSDPGGRQDRAPPSAPPSHELPVASPATIPATRTGATASLDLRL